MFHVCFTCFRISYGNKQQCSQLTLYCLTIPRALFSLAGTSMRGLRRANTAVTNVIPAGVSIATNNSPTSQVQAKAGKTDSLPTDSHAAQGVSIATTHTSELQVKIEKPDTPPPKMETSPMFPPETRLGYHPQCHAFATPRRTRRLLSYLPQCSVCLKTFSRSGTLRVLYHFCWYSF